MSHPLYVAVSSSSKLFDEVPSSSAGHQLDPVDSRGDPVVLPGLSSSESASRTQPSSHDEPYEQSQPERLYYDAAPLRPPLPTQPPSGISCGMVGGTGVRGAWRPSHPQGPTRNLSRSKPRMDYLQEDLLVMQCFCIGRSGVLLGGLFGMSRSVEH